MRLAFFAVGLHAADVVGLSGRELRHQVGQLPEARSKRTPKRTGGYGRRESMHGPSGAGDGVMQRKGLCGMYRSECTGPRTLAEAIDRRWALQGAIKPLGLCWTTSREDKEGGTDGEQKVAR